MIDNYLLEELVAFAKYGTLAASAEHLMVTQPTVTRGMQKLEEQLGVKLFNRTPNKIALTETGNLAAKEAQKLLAAQEEFIQQIQGFDRRYQEMKLGFCLPGPQLVVQEAMWEQVTILPGLLNIVDIEDLLNSRQVNLIISNQELYTDQIESLYLGREELYLEVDSMTTINDKNELNFKDLTGMSFLVLSGIGIWKTIIEENIPDAKFLYQQNSESLSEITRYSNFPYFTTNLTQQLSSRNLPTSNRRIAQKIRDEEAKVDFYVQYLIEDKPYLKEWIDQLQKLF